jgi:hypothetical protein
MKEEIENESLQEREKQLEDMGVPVHLRRALTSVVCAVCLERHEFQRVVIL